MLERHPMKRCPGSRHERDAVVRAVCQECSVGCGLLASVKDGRIVDVQGDEDHPVSRGRLCARGTAFVQGPTSPDRLVAPAARRTRGADSKPLDDWKSGLDLLAERLRRLKERHGPDALAIACDADGGLEFQLGARRFARLWGTSQVFHSSPAPIDPWPEGLDSPTTPCREWARADCLLLVEADVAATHPVAFGWIQEAQRRGARVVAADARFSATLAKADVAVRMRPGRGNLLGLALAKLALSDRGVIEGAFSDPAPWLESLEQMSLEGADAALGIPLETLRHVAGLLAKHEAVTVVTGRDLVALPHHRVWLALARSMGWIGRSGGGWYPLDAGTPPLAVEGDPGEGDAACPARSRSTLAELEERGDVKAIVCSGDALDDALSPLGRLAERAELVAHFGAFPNRTWQRADLTFPATLWAEREGLFFAGDRSVEWARPIVPPPAACRSGLDFWVELARRFGWEAQFPWGSESGRADAGAFHEWLLARSPALVGVSLEALREPDPRAKSFWPGGEGAHPAALRPSSLEAPRAPATLASAAGAEDDPGYPLALVVARTGSRSGDASRFWTWTRGLVREDAVQIHPDTARLLGIESGDEVMVDTPRGALPARASVSRAVSRWTVGVLQGAAGLPALVRRTNQSAAEARALLDGSRT